MPRPWFTCRTKSVPQQNSVRPRHQASQIDNALVFPIKQRSPPHVLHPSRLILDTARVVRDTPSFHLSLVVFLLMLEQHSLKYSVETRGHRVALSRRVVTILLVVHDPETRVLFAWERLKSYRVLSSTTQVSISCLTSMTLPLLLVRGQKRTVETAKPIERSPQLGDRPTPSRR